MKAPPLLEEHPPVVQFVLAVVVPAIYGAVTGYLLGVSEGTYLVLALLAVLGGVGAGFDHDGAGAGAKRGLLGGTLFGAFVLIAHEIHGATAKADLPDPAILLVLITALLGVLLGALGGHLRARSQRGRTRTTMATTRKGREEAVTPITTPFGFTSTAAEVVEDIDLSGRRAIVTGGASGIGIETARALAGAGAEVTVAVRDTERGARVADEIDGDVRVAPLDLADLHTVRELVDAWDGPLDLLINNAGVMAIQELTLNDAGLEMQFATNHVGHFALATALHDRLAAADGGARIVSVSSSGHLRSPVVFDDINFQDRDYEPFEAYGQSKTANVLFAVGVTDRWARDGIFANALMPGGIATNLQRHQDPEYMQRARERARRDADALQIKTPEQGAATSVLLATSPQLEGVGGRYFEDCNEAEPNRDGSGFNGVAPYALDRENADRLWELSLEMIQ